MKRSEETGENEAIVRSDHCILLYLEASHGCVVRPSSVGRRLQGLTMHTAVHSLFFFLSLSLPVLRGLRTQTNSDTYAPWVLKAPSVVSIPAPPA